ncbi:PQQ-binding-like beta-propeller repeat protein [Streptomyces sp. NPDC058674]|uniref:PQQ-binding-like beta-propeller repeat protein n=1 Tax=Streptomyces sp. NPDC058674 TaxID=3346592 RepID=UPI00365493FC
MCSGPFAVVAVDPASGQQLWQLRDDQDGRKAPTVTAVWHGRVYGTAAGGAVALDARTGRDMPTRPEAAPILVNEFGGLVLSEGILTSYPAGG